MTQHIPAVPVGLCTTCRRFWPNDELIESACYECRKDLERAETEHAADLADRERYWETSR